MRRHKSRCSDPCKPRPRKAPTPPAPPTNGDPVLAGGILFSNSGTPGVIGPKGILEVQTGSPAPGVKSWILTLGPAAVPPQPKINYIVFGQQIFNNAQAFFQPRANFLLFGDTFKLEVTLLDSAGILRDIGDALVPFSILRGSNADPILSSGPGP
jgi:hypothetical protein